MPTIDISKKDLESLLGKKLSMQELADCLLYVKGEIDGVNADTIKVDVKETLRPDVWSTEGIARELKAKMGMEKGLPNYKVSKAKISCTIDQNLEKVRPFIACAIIRNVKVTEDFLIQMIQLQEKVGTSFGRKRKEAGIGLYDFDKMKPPVFYRGYKDKEIEYAPLEYRVKMHPSEILAEHPKGKEFGHLLKGHDRYPIVIDSAGTVASMPPIINSETTGKITPKTRDIFIESTGYDWEKVNIALKVLCMALADRGGKIEAVKIIFPKTKTYPKGPIETPFFGTKKISVPIDYFRQVSGLELSEKELTTLLERARYSVKKKGTALELEYPDFRNDIMHPVDVVEDVLISYDYNKAGPIRPKLAVVGEELMETGYLDKVRDICVGLGLQEVLTFNLTSREKQEKLVGLSGGEFIEIANPVSSNWSMLRKNIYPELLEFLQKNKDKEYPQKIFEVGKTLEQDKSTQTGTKERNKLCVILCAKGYGFTEAKSALEAIARELGKKISVSETSHPSLKKGKSGHVSGDLKGIVGEIADEVLANFGLEQPAIMIEIEI